MDDDEEINSPKIEAETLESESVAADSQKILSNSPQK